MPTAHLKGKLSLNDGLFRSGLRRAGTAARGFAKTLAGNLKSFVTSPMAQLSAGLVGFFAYDTFKSGILGAIQAGAELYKLHRITGVAVGSLAVMEDTFEATRVSTDLMAPSITKMQRALVEAAKGSRLVNLQLESIGLSIEELDGLDPAIQFTKFAKAITSIEDPARRTAAAMGIFGKSGFQILPALEKIARQDLGKLFEKAKMLDESAKAFHEVAESLREAGENLRNIWIGMAKQLLPSLRAMGKMITSFSGIKFGTFLGENLQKAIDFVAGLFTDRSPLKKLFEASHAILAGIAEVFMSLGDMIAKMQETMTIGLKKQIRDLAVRGMGATLFGPLGVMFGPKIIDKFFGQATEVNQWTKTREGIRSALDQFSSTIRGITEAGREAIRNFAGEEAKLEAEDPWKRFSHFLTFQLPAFARGKRFMDRSSPTMLGLSEWRTGGMFDESPGARGTGYRNPLGDTLRLHGMQTAFGQSDILRSRERRLFMDQAVAAGVQTRTLQGVARGDRRRRQEFMREQERAKSGTEKTNELLSGILNYAREAVGE